MASVFASRLRKGFAATAFGVRSSSVQVDAMVPTITSGTGVPATTAPPGSVFLRTDSSTADTALYVMISTTWTAILGAT